MSQLYGIVDTARDPALYDVVMACAEKECLFAGKLDPALARVAPYLVKLDPDSPLFTAWRNDGWGRNWGILCYSGLPLDRLRRHFRHFLQAMLPDGTVALFRFYDPRVWRTYAANCEPQEAQPWFSAVDEFLAEAPDGLATLRYRLINGALQVA